MVKIVVSDPCYTIDTHCLYFTDIDNGSYYITPHKPDNSNIELTLLLLDIKFEDVVKTEKLLSDNIGVDTGLFGFFDYDWFVDIETRFDNMHNNEYQFVTPTFVGDGIFEVFGYYLEDKLVGLKLK